MQSLFVTILPIPFSLSIVHKKFPSQTVQISERCLDQPRPLKLIYIGTGVSGIIGAIEFMKKVPNLELVIYEKTQKSAELDVPSHAYQLSFESYPRWSQFFAVAPEILEYWKTINNCMGARWSETSSRWLVQIRDLKTLTNFEDEADVLMIGEGVLNAWAWPEISGIRSFQGELLHSADWKDDFNSKDKSVAVIGSGSSGIQIVPDLLPSVKSMDHYVRGRTWIPTHHGGEDFERRMNGAGENFSYMGQEKDGWENDREAYLQYRRTLEQSMQSRFGITHRESPLQKDAKERFAVDMQKRLNKRPDVMEHILPDFPPLCKRLTPGPGYIEALMDPKVNVIPIAISHIDEKGVYTSDGVHHPVDAIVCATGFTTTPGARGFPIYGRGSFSNFFQSLGPNAFQGAGNLLIMIEYPDGGLHWENPLKLTFGNMGVIEPKIRAVQNFTNFCDEYFKRTVYSEECNSWYKATKGTVTALWPGSSLHAIKTLENVRREDFELQVYDAEKDLTDDVEGLTWYLNDIKIPKKGDEEEKVEENIKEPSECDSGV
ncbi:FAD/NAD(P)-binding domain-containing protein [Delitschia confertaspora ATCC 74209]|uniref:FAD/NAD(P)-binding domain-containing protein n=1 Tax=Delitschia confertaspora ATCC 74209 TaxID=1513339 RepID=A0A9P4JID1_9PLEO|nr:FAD/NAD(P)-binding domain-containing protein [Delitschia confertaspora ATCC 74209]